MKLAVNFLLLFLVSCGTSTDTSLNTRTSNSADSALHTSDTEQTNNTAQQLPFADSAIHHFFSHLDNVDAYIQPKVGLYCIEPGPGVTPLLEILSTKEDLLGKTPFLFLCRDIAFVKNTVLLNPAVFDPCSDTNQGYVIQDVTQSQKLLQEVYQLNQLQQGNTVNDSTLNRLMQLDKRLYKSVRVYFTEKHGEPVTLQFYFYKTNNDIYLGAIDLRDCGV